MSFILKIKPKAQKAIDKVPEEFRFRVWQILIGIKDDPYLGKKLSGKHMDEYSVRVWPFRIIYEIRKAELIIVVIRFKHRKDAYK